MELVSVYIDLTVPFNHYTSKIVGRKAIFNKTLDLCSRPMIGERIRVHDFFEGLDYDGEEIVGTVDVVDHGHVHLNGKSIPGLLIEVSLNHDEQYHEGDMIEIHDALKQNGWILGSVS